MKRIRNHQLGRGWKVGNVEMYESGWTLICSNYGRILRSFYRGVLLVVLISLSGCAARVKTVTNLPPGVTQAQAQAWDSEVATLGKVATATSALRQTVIGLEQAGAFPDTVAYVKALQAVAKIDQAELAASAYLKQQPEYFGVPQKQKVQGLLNDIGAQIQGLNLQTLVGIKDPAQQKQFSTAVADLTSVVNIALALVN